MTRIAFILRGLPGAGKTTVASLLVKDQAHIVEADHYMINENGEYAFDQDLVPACHEMAFNRWRELVQSDVPVVVAANTAPRISHVRQYLEAAKQAGRQVHVLVVENYEGFQSLHQAPTLEEDIARMQANFELHLASGPAASSKDELIPCEFCENGVLPRRSH